MDKNAVIERRLAFQFGIIATILVIFGIGFMTLPRISQNRWLLLTTTLLYIVTSGNNPFVYLWFNSAIRNHVKKFARKCLNTDNVVPVAFTNVYTAKAHVQKGADAARKEIAFKEHQLIRVAPANSA